jgi:hypothetical protein
MAGMAWGPDCAFAFDELYRVDSATNPWLNEPNLAWTGSYFAMAWIEEIPEGSEPRLTLLQPACRP